MTWAQEILRAYLLAFGAFEIFTNLSYILKGQGMQLARKQHGELPSNTGDKNIKIKVICMLVFGTAFFIVALHSYILHGYMKVPIHITAILFSIYGLIEAAYYKYWKTFGFAFVTIVLAVCTFIA